MSTEDQAVYFNAVPLLVVAAAYLLVAAALGPTLWRERRRAGVSDIALALVFPGIGIPAAILGAVVLWGRTPVGGHVWPSFAACVIALIAPVLVGLVRWQERTDPLLSGARAREAEELVSLRDRELDTVAGLATSLAAMEDPVAAGRALLDEIAAVRRVVELGRQARAQSGIKLRQPLRRLVVQGADGISGHAGEIAEELSVKGVEFGDVDASELRVKPNLPVLGPKLGRELASVRAALEAGRFEEVGDGRFRVDGHELTPDEVLVERRGKEGWAVAGEDGLTVALELALDPELELEGRVRDLIHEVNRLRKEQGLELTDRIVLTLPEAEAELLLHKEWIKEETLAVEIRTDGAELQIAKAS